MGKQLFQITAPLFVSLLISLSAMASDSSLVELKKGDFTIKQWQQLTVAARDLSHVWGDTILEGDVEVRGHFQIEKIFAVREHEEIIGYKVEFSETAYDNLEDVEGKIVDRGYVSLDLQSWNEDEEFHEQFFANTIE